MIAYQDTFLFALNFYHFIRMLVFFSLRKRAKKTAISHLSRFLATGIIISLMWCLSDNFAPTGNLLLVDQ